MNEYAKGIEYFDKAVKLAKQIGNIVLQCDALNNLGESYHRAKDYDKALKYYQLSSELSSESNDLFSKATSLNNIGSIYRSKKEYKKALPFLLQCLEINTEHENLSVLRDNYLNLAMVYEGLGNYKKAYFYHCKFSELNDSLSSESVNKKIVDLQIKLETEKKEKEIESLKGEKKVEAGIKNYLFALLTLGVLLIIVIFILFLIKVRANRSFALKNELISIQRDQISKTLEVLNKTNEANENYLEIISEELARASDYVISLIPPEISTGNIRTQWMLKPSSKLGGDSFGYHWLDSNHLAIYLLDVSGHGVGASLHSISILNTIKYQTLTNTDFAIPENVLVSLNTVYQMREHNKLFFTIWYGVYNKETKELKFATAGHPPAILVDNDGKASFLGTKNFVIGGTKQFDYSSNSVMVNPKSKLFVYSDGVYEIKDKEGNFWTIDDLKNFLMSQAIESENEIIELYKFAVNYHENDTLDDDFSILKVIFG
jgi:serine phosphatase RsbU (regulator of sigma subunit)